MSTILVLGHKNPDTDSICSAIAYSNLKNQLGLKCEAVRLGEINKETEYVLNHFQIEKPRLIEKVEDNQNIILVDHNEAGQSVENRENAKILEIIDHHRIDLATAEPINMRFETVGCSSTIISKIYEEKNVKITEKMAGVMLSAILSDTLIFKSPTCTEEDIIQAKKLAKIAGLDYEKYGMDMLIAGTALNDKSAEELYNIDMKPFSFGNEKSTIAQVNTVDINAVLEKKDDLKEVMTKLIDKEALSFAALMITDIISESTELLVVGNKTLAKKAFNMDMTKDTVNLPKVVSRKKQIVPPLTEAAK
jgi:manganese-dependent inorganic pyrophosphatase